MFNPYPMDCRPIYSIYKSPSHPISMCMFLLLWSSTRGLGVWNPMSHWTLALLFSTTLCVVSLEGLKTFSPHRAQMFLYTIPATWLCLSVYIVRACTLHPATMLQILSRATSHSLKLGSCLLCRHTLIVIFPLSLPCALFICLTVYFNHSSFYNCQFLQNNAALFLLFYFCLIITL